ncbi:MAG TPA: hypothetical protein VMF67_07435 [Rhizomicrobium sp.]|nr:hypothetical protein [Rhizomicrobium sp.]
MSQTEGYDPSVADLIRNFLVRRYVQSARAQGTDVISIRAGDVHKEIGFVNRMPLICSVLDGKRFREENGLELIDRNGPRQGSTVTFRFRLTNRESVRRPPSTAIKQTSAVATPLRASDQRCADTICLVSCVSKKRTFPEAAKNLYVSDWFRKARAFVERKGYRWYVLSAEYGLVAPDAVIAPYERTLNTMSIQERRVWAERVLAALFSSVPDLKSVVILAGSRYREFIADALRDRRVQIDIPMEGLRIGEQLSWLAHS